MWKGIYRHWNPIPELQGVRLYCQAVQDDREGFRIWLYGEPQAFVETIIVRFEVSLLYTNSEERYRLNGIENINELKFPHTFWKVENSELLQEFHRQSEGIYEDEEITHYAFLSCDACIDVLSKFKPSFDYDKESLRQLSKT